MAARDIVMVMVLVFVFAIGFLIVHYAATTMVDSMSGISIINESNATMESLKGVGVVSARLDYVIFGLFLALVLALIISGYFIGGMPIFMFIYFIIVVITVVISTVIANVWETVTTTSVLGASLGAFPITDHLVSYLPLYMSIVGFVGLIAMFAKPLSQGGGYS